MFRGELDRLHLGDILQWLTLGNLSGRLTLIGSAYGRNFDFLDGRIVFASSEDPAERLATWLAQTRRAGVADLRRCLALSLFRRQLFTDVLIERGIVAQDTLREAITELAQVLMTRLILTQHLRFRFDDAFPVRDVLSLDLDLDPHQLLLEAARRSDESGAGHGNAEQFQLPLSGELFETFFREVMRDGITADEPIDGQRLDELHDRISMITSTLGAWLETSPGLVPLPAQQADQIQESTNEGEPLPMYGAPHIVWNRMVIACSVRAPSAPPPEELDALTRLTEDPELGREMIANETWRRVESPRLDRLAAVAASQWGHLARIAASVLEASPQSAMLAAHLLVVPTDLVLWGLATVPVPHSGAGRAVLHRLARRTGTVLSARADFPHSLGALFKGASPTPLAVSLHLAKPYIASSSVWLDPVPLDSKCPDLPADLIDRASQAVQEAAQEIRQE